MKAFWSIVAVLLSLPGASHAQEGIVTPESLEVSYTRTARALSIPVWRHDLDRLAVDEMVWTLPLSKPIAALQAEAGPPAWVLPVLGMVAGAGAGLLWAKHVSNPRGSPDHNEYAIPQLYTVPVGMLIGLGAGLAANHFIHKAGNER